MPALFRHTLIFEGGGHGFSEALYFEMPSDDIAAAQLYVEPIKDKRAPLLGTETQIKGDRVTLVINAAGNPVKNRALVRKFHLPGNANEHSCPSNLSLQVQWSTVDASKKKLMFMGGVWRNIFPNLDAFNPNYGTWGSQFQAWRSLMQEKKMGWLAAPGGSEAIITGYTFDADTGFTTYTIAAGGIVWPNLSKPVPVSVEFPLSRSPLDGRQLVIPLTATSIQTAQQRPAAPFTVPGKMVLKSPTFVSIGVAPPLNIPGSINAQNPMSRKRGRPLLVSVGKAPVQRRW